MRESDLLAHIAARSANLAARFGQVVVGPGDDCAVVRTPSGDDLLLTVDHLVEGRHVDPGTPVDLIARKAVARSVSDIAAMGGVPSWGLATACLPRGEVRADALFDAMHRWANHWGCPLVGGDISTSDGPLVLTVTVGGVMSASAVRGWLGDSVGAAPERAGVRPVLRSGARPGDAVLVTGAVGGAVASGRHLSFEPRLRQGQIAAWGASGVTSMIDVSDGLGRDAGRVARASGVVLEMDATHIPLHPDAGGWERGVREGDDYELLMTRAPGGLADGLLGGIPIGWVRACEPGEAPGAWVTDAAGIRHEVSRWGWEHE